MTTTDTEITLSHDELVQVLEDQAARFGQSAGSMLAARDAGSISSSADVSGLLILADLLTDDQQRQLR